MINNPKLIEEIIQDIKNTSKEELDKAIEETKKEFERSENSKC